jgi:protein-tyrosine phosphatase
LPRSGWHVGDGEEQGSQQALLFVCLGNICRSPTAEGVMRDLLRREGLERQIRLDSAGTGAWHIGEPPDARATAAARARGIALEGAARQVRAEDFEDFDLLLAMDRRNVRDLHQLAPDAESSSRIRLLREFDPLSDGDLDVPDPYHGGPRGFEDVLDLVQAACLGLLAEVRGGGGGGEARGGGGASGAGPDGGGRAA